ncbi:MAG: CoA ester lyase [Dehalococcoidia bacterium]
MILHRSHLFVPGARSDMLDKCGQYPADVLCLDLEEAVLPDDKPRARELVHAAVAWLSGAPTAGQSASGGGRTVHVRVNSIESGLTRDDLAAAVQPGLAGVVLAKTRSPQDVRDVDVLLREQELAHEVRAGTVALIVAIESAQALLRCEEISRASTRISALMLGGEDFAFDMGVPRTKRGRELWYARNVVATCARAANLVALDTPWTDIADLGRLEADAKRARSIGFSGKYVIHPTHIEAVHAAFSPRADEIAGARKVLAAWDDAQAKGLGAIQLDGRMVDRPIAERARHVIEMAEAIAAHPNKTP